MSETIESAMGQNQSFWQHKYGPYIANSALTSGDHQADVVIIGGGFTGLTCARELLKDQSDLKVVVLEASEIGFGASGRNGGFNMSLFGVEPETTVMRWGKEKSAQAQSYMQQAVKYVNDLITTENLNSDYEHSGMWRVAYSDSQVKRLRKTFELLTSITKPGSYEFLEQASIQEKLNSPHIKAAIYESQSGILDPCKHVRELKRLALKAGAHIYENTKVLDMQHQGDHVVLKTNNSTITADKVVMATNAWSHAAPGPKKVQNRQRPVWTYQIVSDPLTEQEWQELGWNDRMSIEDNRQMVHYLRITKCGRITMGGGNIATEYGKDMDKWHDQKIWLDLEKHFHWMFPTLKHKKIHYKWGGAVSVNLDMVPEIGFINDERIIYSSGCQGHGVSLTQLNGRLIADLVLNKKTELTNFWIVNRNSIPMPPGNLLPYLGVNAIVGILKTMDWIDERPLDKSTGLT